ncbi:MAG TPA: rhodanese-related sulfurtransferase [Candidatus Dependentiae bacterium]|nr:rhodanese-related sulfurtransferase [Candidatus Dependentiae bacterium]
MGNVLLYYKYVMITYPKHIMKWQKTICHDLDLTGRIIISHEGINGTVGGTQTTIERYKTIMRKNSLFSDIDFKESLGGADCFSRLSIIVKDEIVHLGLNPHVITADEGGKQLTPTQAHALIKKQPADLLIFDVRNKVEWKIGHFQQALTADINHFRELPNYIDTHLDQFSDKQVLMYCTGGIRCERASAYLKSKNVAKQVYQLKGGIHRYVEHYPDGFFRGKNYVFDNRISLKVTDEILGSCLLCRTPGDNYTNCLNAACNKHFICCNPCLDRLDNTCSTACYNLVEQNKVNKRPLLKTTPHYVNRKART